MYSMLSTMHDYESGGTQLDQVLIDHFAKEFLKKHKSDPRQNERSLAKLKLEAEATKKALSLGANASLSVESLAEGIDFSSTINRTRYELLASKVFAAFTRLVEDAVRKADLDVLDIDEVLPLSLTSFCRWNSDPPIGNPVRRNVSYAPHCISSFCHLSVDNNHSLPFNFTDVPPAILSCCPRRRHPGVPDPRIRYRRHRTIYASHGHRNPAPTARHRCSTRQRG